MYDNIIMRRIYIFLFMLMSSVMILAQERVITGVVLDGEFKGEPLIGANVTVGQGQSTRGVVTDLDGKFSLNVPANTQKVVVSYMGYKSYTLKLKQGVNNYKVTLYYADKSLDEFVVTGYSTPSCFPYSIISLS